MYNLTEGALEKIMRGTDVKEPVLQILNYEKLPKRTVNKDGVGTDRYRLLVSDGQRYSFTMLDTQLNNLITDDILNEYAICRILNYDLSSVNNSGKEKLLILRIEVLVSGSEVGYKIGNPTNIDIESEAESTSTSITGNFPFPTNGADKRDTSNYRPFNISTTRIAALNPFQNIWVIKVRVTSKSPIKPWSNTRKEGKLFSMDLIDESGEIRCTAFNDLCDKFYDMIEPGNVYYISRCTLREAKKQYNTLKNDYEMTMIDDTAIVPCHESSDAIPTLQFNFCPISQVENKEKNDIIDVLGVVTTFNDVRHIVQQNTGQKFVKRDVNIVDDSGTMVCVTLWGKQAEDFDSSNNAILAIKGALVDEFHGRKNLSLLNSSVFKKDPDLPKAHRLREWYTTVGHSVNAKSLPRAGGSGDINTPLCTFQEVTETRLGEKINLPDSFKVVAIISTIRPKNAIYKACPVDSCKKKLIDQSTGVFKCEKCNKDYPNFTYRLLASMNVVDATGCSRWITVFNEDAEKILGMSVQELAELKENDNDAYMQKFDKVNFKRFLFSLRAESEIFQDKMRIKLVCTSVAPLNYKIYLSHLIDKVTKSSTVSAPSVAQPTQLVPTQRYATHYNMNHSKRGIALIFNHEIFTNPDLQRRQGTNKDCENLTHTLETLGFEVKAFQDLTHKDVVKQLEIASKMDHSEHDCLVIAVLSHGKLGLLSAYDTEYEADFLWHYFTADLCPSLAGRPKLFFIQACRGNKLDPGFNLKERTETDGKLVASKFRIPIQADFLIAYATFPGYYSWRDPNRGSWFIEALNIELRDKGNQHDLLTLLTFVCQRVALKYESNTPDRMDMHQQKQIPCFTSTLTRIVKFTFPRNGVV